MGSKCCDAARNLYVQRYDWDDYVESVDIRLVAAQHARVSKRVDLVTKALGRRIRQLRTDRKWSQERLAEEASMHRTYIWGIEQGLRNPSLRHLTQVADALGVPVSALFTTE